MRVDGDSSEAKANSAVAVAMKMRSRAFKPHECNSRCASCRAGSHFAYFPDESRF